MADLPITRMTLYKHGVGFFERRATFNDEQVELSFRVNEMNDILKSLTVIDWGDGQVLGVDYATPQSRRERLAGCSIRLDDERSLRDLLIGLRGRRVKLVLLDETLTGTLLGLDEADESQPMATSLVSLLLAETNQVQAVALERVQGVDILDQRGASDLRFFLETALSQDDFRRVTIRLTPGEHELSVSYIAPAPTWRVSYRLVADRSDSDKPQALLMGWGIFDNRLEEDLDAIELSLVAGMPISFVYDLYTPFTPDRPVVKEEARVAAGPVEFEEAVAAAPIREASFGMMDAMEAMPAAPAPKAARARGMSRQQIEKSATVTTTGESLGELFQYNIGTPVTVGRGQSAMVPIVSTVLPFRKELLYNGSKMATHPVASLRFDNTTSLTLERGPVTVLENGDYVGEAVLPFTPETGEVVVAYAVELGVKVQERGGRRREIHQLRLSDSYLLFEEWEITKRTYRANNGTGRSITILIEHPRNTAYDLHETTDPSEMTAQYYRFEVTVPAKGETELVVQERRLVTRREELRRQSYVNLQRYLRQGLLDRRTHDFITELLGLWEQVNNNERLLAELEKERQKVYKAQQQIQGNMGALGQTGKEGNLRLQYVNRLEESERQLTGIAEQETKLNAEITRLNRQIEAKLKSVG